MTRTRIYYVTADDGEQRLVRAATEAAAIRHAARGRYRANVAAQETLVELLSDGVKVETAGEEPLADPGPANEPVTETETRAAPVVVPAADWPFPPGEKDAA